MFTPKRENTRFYSILFSFSNVTSTSWIKIARLLEQGGLGQARLFYLLKYSPYPIQP